MKRAYTPEQRAAIDRLVANWDVVLNGPAPSVADVERILKPAEAPPQEVLRLLDVAGMVASDPPAIPWVIENLAIAGTLTLLSGKEGEGKSLTTMALAAGVGAGHDVAGFSCNQTDVMIVDAENGEYEIHRRVKSLGLPATGVDVVEADGFHLGRDLGLLEALLVKARPGLVILDSFRSLWPGGEENDSAAVAEVIDPLRNLLRRLQIAGVLLHHVSRSGNDYRGSSAIGAAIELGFRLGRAPDDPEARDRRFLRCFKCRPAPEPEDRWLRLHLERGQVFVDEAEPFGGDGEDEQALPPVRAELAPDMLRAAIVPIEWPELARQIGRSPKDGTARRLRDDLLRSGELTRAEDGRLSVPDGLAPRNGALESQKAEGCHGAATPIGVAELAPATTDEEAEAERLAAKFGEAS